MNKVTLKYAGNGYRGTDPGNNNAEIVCADGQDVAVSEVKAVQLLKDYPKNFTRTGATEKADKVEPTPAPAPVATPPAPTVPVAKEPEAPKPEPTAAPKPKPAPKPAAKPAAKPKAPAKKTNKKR